MSFADELRGAKAADERKAKEREKKAKEQFRLDMVNLSLYWCEQTLKGACMNYARTGRTECTVKFEGLSRAIGKRADDDNLQFRDELDKRFGSGFAKRIEGRLSRKTNKTKLSEAFCVTAEDKSIIEDTVKSYFEKEGVTVKFEENEVKMYNRETYQEDVSQMGLIDRLSAISDPTYDGHTVTRTRAVLNPDFICYQILVRLTW